MTRRAPIIARLVLSLEGQRYGTCRAVVVALLAVACIACRAAVYLQAWEEQRAALLEPTR